MELRFRIKSFIFPNWCYSDDHWKLEYFFKRWESQYIDKPEFDPVMQQLVNGVWVDVYYNNPT